MPEDALEDAISVGWEAPEESTSFAEVARAAGTTLAAARSQLGLAPAPSLSEEPSFIKAHLAEIFGPQQAASAAWNEPPLLL